ncbi:unnamed protein product [Mytilus coruscus]|uniref:VWFA domain-containing protein n=1 Tax=Mytilus coruscus TaxID=42192 RepID=A0A6J8EWM9_MYTCO|nr:unnamed protein product [Mytilus coruscus]
MDLNEISGILIAFDQEKAFDRVEHEFILQVLRAMNFPSNFIRWIEIIYTDITSKVIINGALSDKIVILRSIRQGCPISISIKALIIETLACKIRTNNNIQGIQIPNHNSNVKLFNTPMILYIKVEKYLKVAAEITKFQVKTLEMMRILLAHLMCLLLAINPSLQLIMGKNILEHARKSSFTKPNGDRPDAQNIALVMTDGGSDNKDFTCAAAQKMRDDGILVFAIPIGSNINEDEIKCIETDSSFRFAALNFEALKLPSFRQGIARKILSASKPQTG